MTRTLILGAALAALAIGGCAGETNLPKATGKGSIRAINAISTAPPVLFLIEERQIGFVDYKRSSQTRAFDDLGYTFNFETAVTGNNDRTRIASQYIDVTKDKDYTIVVTGSLSAPDLLLWETDIRSWTETETAFRWRFAHTSDSTDQVDVYFAEPGVEPQLGQQVATLSFGEIAAALEFPAGNYVLTYTAAGDPATVLFASGTLTPTPRNDAIVSIFDADANDLAPLAVRIIGSDGTSNNVTSPDHPPTVRLIHAAATVTATDVYIEEEADVLTTPDVTDHAFGDITADIPTVAGLSHLTYTSPGDTSVIFLDRAQTTAPGFRYELFLVGNTDALTLVPTIPDRRPYSTLAKLSIIHTAITHPVVNMFLVDPDGSLAESSPVFFQVLVGSEPSTTSLRVGNADLYIEANDANRTVLAGPYRLDVAAGDIVQLMLLDNVAQPDIVDIAPIPLP